MTATVLLDRLRHVRQTGRARWIACCPAHDDDTPSLSIREIDDRVLVHCFAGCDALDVLDALGLDWTALYLDSMDQCARPRRSRTPARDLLHVLDHEIMVATLILADVLEGRSVDEAQWQRLAAAAARIGRAHDCAR